MPHFDALKMYRSGKHREKRRNCLLGTYFSSKMHPKMSSAICFNLDQSKILSFGNGLSALYLVRKPTGVCVLGLKGRLPQIMQSKYAFCCKIVLIHSLFRYGFKNKPKSKN